MARAIEVECARLAQLAERYSCKVEVIGSTPMVGFVR